MSTLCADSINKSTITSQDGQSILRTRSHHPEEAFSDPVEVHSPGADSAESFDLDDMYGSDDGVETLSESSTDGDSVDASITALVRLLLLLSCRTI
jgi:hypothetical protein